MLDVIIADTLFEHTEKGKKLQKTLLVPFYISCAKLLEIYTTL